MSLDSVYLWTLPMFHCNGWCFPWAVTAAVGAPTSACARSSRRTSGSSFESEGVTHFCAAPTVLIASVNDPSGAHRWRRP